MQLLTSLSILFNVLIVSVVLILIKNRFRLLGKFYLRPGYERDFSFFAAHPVNNDDVVFLGDSITAFFPLDEMFPGVNIKNRGISGDTTIGVLKRLHQITAGQPRLLFLMIGTNDLGFGYAKPGIIHNYDEILSRIRRESPQTLVYVQSILPRHARYVEQIRDVNLEIATLAQKHGYQFIDLLPTFADANGGIRPEFSNDDLHLLEAGYAQWQTLIEQFVGR